MIYFTSDQHFYHKNVIRYCQRPYSDITQMQNDIIKKHNEVVSKKDTVYHLGDFAFLRKDQITKISGLLEKMNGEHHLILGNHDEGKPFTYLNMGFISIHTSLFVDEFLLVHDPAMAVVAEDGQKVLCGHLHELVKWVNSKILNVGVDVWGFKPLSIDYIRKIWEE
ncbi:MAG: metallophosphoesterase [Candidatus Woesearchaeota archaeon]